MAQTPPTDKTTDPEATRIDVYLDQLARVVSAHHLSSLRYVVADGYYSKQKFLGGVCALGLEQISKLRLDANLRYLYQGPPRPGAVPIAKTSISRYNYTMLSYQRRRECTYICPTNEFVDMQVLLGGAIRLVEQKGSATPML